ncbi:hypothetical protein Tco_0800648 [Tanacetum coccineum]|uniref:Uncharacterized protein n=1 Tax=Tanacetum coccineum TaxID=301880 RepID=A0ABQ4ZUP1_9ASTR
MANTQTPLLQELLHVVDSYDIKDQLLVLFQREVAEDSQKMHDYLVNSEKLCGRTLPVNTGYCNLEFLSGLGFGAFTNEAGNYVGRAYFQSGVEIINVLKAHVGLYGIALCVPLGQAGVSCANVEISIEVVNLRKNEVEGGVVALYKATYSCPWPKIGSGRYTPILDKDCPWLLLIVICIAKIDGKLPKLENERKI